MKRLGSVYIVTLIAALAACAARSGLIPGAITPAESQREWSRAQTNTGGPTLYVSGIGGTAIFANGGALFLRKIRPKTGALATDTRGHLYVVGETGNDIDVYQDRGAKLAWKVRTKPVGSRQIAIDQSRNQYVNCGDDNLCEYGPHNQGIVRQIRGHGDLLALDAVGNLYLAETNAVAVYAPGAGSPERMITDGIDGIQALVADAQGNLYVANARLGSQPAPNVTVYGPGVSSPIRTITSGITAPYAMTTDIAGNLYVLNSCVARGSCTNEQNNIAIYAPGSSTPTLVVTQSLDFPVALAVDRSSDLYVANIGSSRSDTGGVTVYRAGTYSLLRTVTHSVYAPDFIALSQ